MTTIKRVQVADLKKGDIIVNLGTVQQVEIYKNAVIVNVKENKQPLRLTRYSSILIYNL